MNVHKTQRHSGSASAVPAAIIVGASVWATHYVVTTASNPDDGPESALLIEPLLYVLLVTAAAALFSTVRSLRRAVEPVQVANSEERYEQPFDNGLRDWRRVLLIVSLPVFGLAIAAFGFLLPAIAYVLLVSFALGVRKLVPLAATTIAVVAVIAAFVKLAAVPLPLWPT